MVFQVDWLSDTLGSTGPAAAACTNGAIDRTVFTTPDEGRSTIHCGIEYVGGDISRCTQLPYSACVQARDEINGCINLTYSDSCHVKNNLAGIKANGLA